MSNPPNRSINVYGVEIAIGPDFITPDFQQLVDAYPSYCSRSRRINRTPADPQPYLTKICEGLAEAGVREDRTATDWWARMVGHFGLRWVTLALEKMSAAKRSA
jgi:hypothetical protein